MICRGHDSATISSLSGVIICPGERRTAVEGELLRHCVDNTSSGMIVNDVCAWVARQVTGTIEVSALRRRGKSSFQRSPGRAAYIERLSPVRAEARGRAQFPCPILRARPRELVCPGATPRPNGRGGIGRKRTP